MEQRIVVVSWATQAGACLPYASCHVASEALRLSVWRAGGIALACRVTPALTRMVIQMPMGQHTAQLIEWVRAAARFAVARATAGVPPCWEDAYTYYVVDGVTVAEEITACFMLPEPSIP